MEIVEEVAELFFCELMFPARCWEPARQAIKDGLVSREQRGNRISILVGKMVWMKQVDQWWLLMRRLHLLEERCLFMDLIFITTDEPQPTKTSHLTTKPILLPVNCSIFEGQQLIFVLLKRKFKRMLILVRFHKKKKSILLKTQFLKPMTLIIYISIRYQSISYQSFFFFFIFLFCCWFN